MANAHDVFQLIRSVTLDVNGTVYKDDILLPAVKAAARDLSMELTSRGYEKTEAIAELALAANVTALSATSTPPLPTGFAAPQRLWEKRTGTSDRFVPIGNVGYLSYADATEALREWIWQDGEIRFIGATGPVTVRLEYLRTILPITSSGSSIDAVVGSLNYLAYAGLAIVAMGRADADMLRFAEGKAQVALDKILDTYTSAGQYVSLRRGYYGTGGDE